MAIEVERAGTCWRNRMAASSPCSLKLVVLSNGASEALRSEKSACTACSCALQAHWAELTQYTCGCLEHLTSEDTIDQQTSGQVNVIGGRHPTCLGFSVCTLSKSCSPVILRANATKNFARTDDARTREVRNISITVTLSSSGQRISGTHIGMSMQRPCHHQLKRRTKSHCARSLDNSSQITTRHADVAHKLTPKPLVEPLAHAPRRMH